MFKKLSIIFFISLFLISCDDDPFIYVPDYANVPAAFPRDEAKKTVNSNGLIIYEVQEGIGDFVVNNRDVINGFYTGRLTDNEIFDSSYRDGNTSYTTISIGGTSSQTGGFVLIEGFRQGFIGMKQGGKRVLIIPPALGYASNPSSRFANDTLIFDIEVHSFVSGKVTSTEN